MKKDLHNIDKLFNRALEDHSEQPSENVWKNINEGLDNKKVISLERKYIVLKRAAVAIFILGFASGVFALYFKNRQNNKPETASINTKAANPNVSTNTSVKKQTTDHN